MKKLGFGVDYEALFRETDYVVDDLRFSRDKVVINIDAFHQELDNLLSTSGSWVFITAWNPLPDVLDDNENVQRNDSLRKKCVSLRYEIYSAYGMAKDNSWREDSFLVVGISRLNAIALAKGFGQVGIVYGKKDQKAELIMMDFSHD